MRIAIGTPYRENSVTAIARAAASSGDLAAFRTTFYFAKAAGLVRHVPGARMRRRIRGEVARRAYPGIPGEVVTTHATCAELTHVLARRLLPRRQRLLADLMYRVKVHFDSAVARRTPPRSVDVVVQMYGAALSTFASLGDANVVKVLNFVNSHPLSHNHYLTDLAGLQSNHHECIPEWVHRRVVAEIELADIILVPSQFVAAQMRRSGVAEQKIVVEPYGVDLAGFRPGRVSDVDASPASDGVVHCLYIGQIAHRKGIRFLVDAARRCVALPVSFTLAGPLVSPELLADLPKNVTYHGPVIPGDVPAAMGAADMFVLPSLEDAYGLVTLEAMACGLPVITTDQTGASEIIAHGEDGLVVRAGDAGSLAGAIHQLVADRQLRRAMGIRARAKVESAHSWEDYGARVVARCANVLASREKNGATVPIIA